MSDQTGSGRERRFSKEEWTVWTTRAAMLAGLAGIGYGGLDVKQEFIKLRDDARVYQGSVLEKLSDINSTLSGVIVRGDLNAQRIELLEERVLYLERKVNGQP